MSVRPTVCTTLANGLGRGRSRSARAAPPRQTAAAMAPQRARVFFMGPKVTGSSGVAQGARYMQAAAESSDVTQALTMLSAPPELLHWRAQLLAAPQG